MGHYLIAPLAERGIACLGLNSRYAGNDTVLLMERVIQDLGAGVKFLRDERATTSVVLIGNSGGAALAAFYQAQAEHFTRRDMVDGDPTHIVAADLPPVDGIALCAAHEGPLAAAARLDRSLASPTSTTPLSVDPALDMYDPRHWADALRRRVRCRSSPASARRRQARRDRIEARVLRAPRRAAQRRRAGRATRPSSSTARMPIRAASISSLDANDRRPGSVWGDARAVNYRANAMGRTTSLTAFLSQWSSRVAAPAGPRTWRAPRCRRCC